MNNIYNNVVNNVNDRVLKKDYFCGSNAVWIYVMANASLRSYINHYDQSGLSRPFLWETEIITTQYIHKRVKVNKAINVFKALRKAINKFKANNGLKNTGFSWVQCLWNYMVVKASLRSYIVHHDQSGLSRPNHKGKKWENDDIHNIIFTT
jgi:hypothetical protein